jgi:hypothetical protein
MQEVRIGCTIASIRTKRACQRVASATLATRWQAANGGIDLTPFPMTVHQFALYIAPAITHEVGHSVGLVDPRWLEAIEQGKQKRHNQPYTGTKMMDPGGLFFISHKLFPSPTQCWNQDDLRYLQFILPKE